MESEKRLLLSLMVATLLLATTAPLPVQAATAPGLLQGVPTTTRNSSATDGNVTTGITLGTGTVEWTLAAPKGISSFYIHSNDPNPNAGFGMFLRLYSTSGNLIPLHYRNRGQSDWTHASDMLYGAGTTDREIMAANVSRIQITNSSPQYENFTVYEIEAIEDTTVPGSPTGAKGFALGAMTSSIMWAANPEPDVLKYRVYRDNVMMTETPNLSVRAFYDKGLVPGHTYIYSVAAVDGSLHESPVSQRFAVKTPEATVSAEMKPGNPALEYIRPLRFLVAGPASAEEQLKVKEGVPGFPIAITTTSAVGKAGSLPGNYSVQAKNRAGTVLATGRVSTDGSFTLNFGTPVSTGETVLFRYWQI